MIPMIQARALEGSETSVDFDWKSFLQKWDCSVLSLLRNNPGLASGLGYFDCRASARDADASRGDAGGHSSDGGKARPMASGVLPDLPGGDQWMDTDMDGFRGWDDSPGGGDRSLQGRSSVSLFRPEGISAAVDFGQGVLRLFCGGRAALSVLTIFDPLRRVFFRSIDPPGPSVFHEH